jgi:NAD(P)H dehydrogenase (quinone)
MTTAPRISVIYYSATGNVHELAAALAAGAEKAGGEVRLRRVAESAPDEAIRANEAWQKHVDEVAPSVEQASLDDLEWCDGFALGSPTRFGNATSQLRNFIDTAGGLWSQGKLDGKAATTFTSASTPHGGLESTILAMNNTLYHWGAIVVPLGYAADESLMGSGNPYGASYVDGAGEAAMDAARQAAQIQGERLAQVAEKLAA